MSTRWRKMVHAQRYGISTWNGAWEEQKICRVVNVLSFWTGTEARAGAAFRTGMALMLNFCAEAIPLVATIMHRMRVRPGNLLGFHGHIY